MRKKEMDKYTSYPSWILDIVREPRTGNNLQFDGASFISSNGLKYIIKEEIPCLITFETSKINQQVSSEEYYNQLAKEYRAQDDFWKNPYDNEIWRLEHDLIKNKLKSPGPMLDVGCGFYPHFKFTYDRPVIAGDISFDSLLIAREFGDESKSVFLIQFDATALPFANESFDFVLAGGELLNHISTYEVALSEFFRVLKPGGVLLLQVGAKWCFDSLWAITDSFISHPFGYSIKKREALSFFRTHNKDVKVTWEITPSGEFQVSLILIRRLKKILKQLGFKIIDQYGANCISGLVPLPVQQNSKNKIIQFFVSTLIKVDRIFARLPLFKNFAGNVFLVCRKNT